MTGIEHNDPFVPGKNGRPRTASNRSGGIQGGISNGEDVVLRVLAELKPSRPLQTNVEFYTALLLHGIGLESSLFTPTFAVARVAGWTAHVLEQVAEDRLIRPRVVYAGALGRTWSDPESRSAAVGHA